MLTADELSTAPHQSSLETPSSNIKSDAATVDMKTSMMMQVDEEEENTQEERKATERPRIESVVERRTTSTRPKLAVDREKVSFGFNIILSR